jgi:hypothetical protein
MVAVVVVPVAGAENPGENDIGEEFDDSVAAEPHILTGVTSNAAPVELDVAGTPEGMTFCVTRARDCI